MRSFILFVLLTISFNCFSQSDYPIYSDYLNTTYQIDTIEFKLGKRKLMLFKVFRNEERPDGFIWAQYFDTNSENEMRFLGYMESEDSFYLPNKQPFENYFLIVQAREYNGVLHLLNKDGEWKELPGYYYGVVGKIIYTKAAGDGDQLVTSYNLETNELFTKVYNNINGTDPWGISDNYNYVNINWIKIP